MADLLLSLLVPTSAGGIGWWIATLAAPRRAANDNHRPRVTLPYPPSHGIDRLGHRGAGALALVVVAR